jgi:hypothetical protein
MTEGIDRKTIVSSDFYDLQVYTNIEQGIRQYIVVNKRYSVIEAEPVTFPEAIALVEELSAMTQAIMDEYNQEEYMSYTLH